MNKMGSHDPKVAMNWTSLRIQQKPIDVLTKTTRGNSNESNIDVVQAQVDKATDRDLVEFGNVPSCRMNLKSRSTILVRGTTHPSIL